MKKIFLTSLDEFTKISSEEAAKMIGGAGDNNGDNPPYVYDPTHDICINPETVPGGYLPSKGLPTVTTSPSIGTNNPSSLDLNIHTPTPNNPDVSVVVKPGGPTVTISTNIKGVTVSGSVSTDWKGSPTKFVGGVTIHF